MIIKMIGIVCIMFSTIAIGSIYIDRDKDRLNLLKEIRKMCMLLKGSIRYSGQDLTGVMVDISSRLEIRLKEFLDFIILHMEKMEGDPLCVIWENAVLNKLNYKCLKNTDRESIVKLGDILGYLDKELQIENFEQHIYELNNNIKILEKEMVERSKLYKTISITAGIFIVIIFLN